LGITQVVVLSSIVEVPTGTSNKSVKSLQKEMHAIAAVLVKQYVEHPSEYSTETNPLQMKDLQNGPDHLSQGEIGWKEVLSYDRKYNPMDSVEQSHTEVHPRAVRPLGVF
jgi:hypothetical protein